MPATEAAAAAAEEVSTAAAMAAAEEEALISAWVPLEPSIEKEPPPFCLTAPTVAPERPI